MIYNSGFRFAKKMFTPTPGKLMSFGLVVFLMFIFPTYPTATWYDSERTSHDQSSFFYSNQPLILVLDMEYEWVEFVGPTYLCMESPNTVTYSADPAYLPYYAPFFILAYALSCYFMERIKWPRYDRKMIGMKTV